MADLHNLEWACVAMDYGSNCPHFLILINLLLSLPAHSAQCERGFSQMKLIKTDWRNRLQNDGLTDLMRIKLESADVATFNPDEAIKLWLLGSERNRRLNQKKWAMKKRRCEETQEDEEEQEEADDTEGEDTEKENTEEEEEEDEEDSTTAEWNFLVFSDDEDDDLDENNNVV
jgi:hypothetical protein